MMIAAGVQGRFQLPPSQRWLLWAFRSLVVAVLILLLLLGVRDVVRDVVQPGGGAAGGAASPPPFPREAAEAYAVRFALAYATFDSSDQMSHQQALAPFLPDGADPLLGWNGSGKQTATAAVASGIQVQSPSSADVSVAVLVDKGRWIYLAVPVIIDQGRLLITHPPALLPAPSKASTPSSPAPNDDSQLETKLSGTLADFFKAYAAGSTTELTYMAAPGVVVQGLNGIVNFDSLAELHIPQAGGDTRQATALVRWQDATSNAELTQQYQLTLKLVAGDWRVAAIDPAT
jgi:Conjugative transposon protein TcpC